MGYQHADLLIDVRLSTLLDRHIGQKNSKQRGIATYFTYESLGMWACSRVSCSLATACSMQSGTLGVPSLAVDWNGHGDHHVSNP